MGKFRGRLKKEFPELTDIIEIVIFRAKHHRARVDIQLFKGRNPMNRWLIFVKERVPLLTFAIVTAGISLSAMFLQQTQFQLLPFMASFVGIFFFFILLRLIEEVKDLEKDRIAHKERPLPRGLIKKKEAVRLIELLQPVLFAYSLFVWVFTNTHAALAYASLILYLWFMYKEFGIDLWLHSHPVLYALSHQFVIFPLTIFAVALTSPKTAFDHSTWYYASMLLGAFFTYEICRKLDPHAHPVLATYIHFYGFRKTFEIAAILVALSAMGAISLELSPILLPIEIVVLVSLTLVFFQAAWYRIPQFVSAVSLLLHIWAIPLRQFF